MNQTEYFQARVFPPTRRLVGRLVPGNGTLGSEPCKNNSSLYHLPRSNVTVECCPPVVDSPECTAPAKSLRPSPSQKVEP